MPEHKMIEMPSTEVFDFIINFFINVDLLIHELFQLMILQCLMFVYQIIQIFNIIVMEQIFMSLHLF